MKLKTENESEVQSIEQKETSEYEGITKVDKRNAIKYELKKVLEYRLSIAEKSIKDIRDILESLDNLEDETDD